MSIVPRLKASPGVLVRTLVSLGAVLAAVAALWGGAPRQWLFVLHRGRHGVRRARPRLGVRGPCRPDGHGRGRPAVAAAAGPMYERLGGLLGADALDATNLAPLAALLALLPVVVNATFYLELALGRSLAWVDAWLTARWETIVYACSAGLALAWLRLAHAGLGPVETFVAGAVLATATATSVYVVRLGVRADELALIQGLSQVIARDISLAKSFARIQELTRRLVPWEQMGFARYDSRTNQMELVADTAAGGRTSFRFDANAGLTGEAVR